MEKYVKLDRYIISIPEYNPSFGENVNEIISLP